MQSGMEEEQINLQQWSQRQEQLSQTFYLQYVCLSVSPSIGIILLLAKLWAYSFSMVWPHQLDFAAAFSRVA
jgi:hypothetical protein